MRLTGKIFAPKSLTGSAKLLDTIKGDSAYEVALKNGFEGTEEEWLASLKGADAKAVLTTAQIQALEGMFKVCAFVKADVTAEYEAFKNAFYKAEEEPEEPDVPIEERYSISSELTNVTSSNKNTSVVKNGSYVTTLTVDDGYAMTSVVVTMGGEDITSTAYVNGVVEIDEVTGDISIVAVAEFVVIYTITKDLVNITSDNGQSSVTEGESYTATLTVAEGYTMDSVVVKMGGVDVTADVYADGVITISAVTGNVEIVASAVEEAKPAELVTDGLLFDFDFRNASMASYNLTGWGNVYGMRDKYDYAFIFGSAAATGDDVGLSSYNFRENRLVSAETTKVQLGTTYTAQALYRAKTVGATYNPNLFNFGAGSNLANRVIVNPIYLVGTTETKVGNSESIVCNYSTTGYILVTYVVDGAILKIYYNESLIAEYNGADYDGFTKWVDYGIPNVVYNTGIAVSFVGYNRALSQEEVVDNIEYFKTLGVA